MQAKSFQVIADIIQAVPDENERRLTAMRFKVAFEERFPRFKPHLFLKACGLTKAEVAFLHDLGVNGATR